MRNQRKSRFATSWKDSQFFVSGKQFLLLFVLVLLAFFLSRFLVSLVESTNPSTTQISSDVEAELKNFAVEIRKKWVTFEDVVILSTEKGDIVMSFYPQAAPKTVQNFKALVEKKFFDGDGRFYRSETDFVLQGGTWPDKPSPFPPVPLEYKLPNEKYAVSMARTNDPDSATTEFSIMLKNNSYWNGPFHDNSLGYAVFAQVIDGWDVVTAITKLHTVSSHGMTMLDPVVKILNATLIHSYRVLYDNLLVDNGGDP
eukprot:TRINITY_DN1147_c0_g2_i3.p1 TRINITY_DN1147_c0_g2~~TRINITY_DN1147_c0_g2_i3.p1  ORF type:complete len:256 (-),score=34.02 TRINITY_DN1147_c0_g2_i3:87-854(-)